MATLPEALYALPTARLRELVRVRKVDPKKLAMIPNKRQLAQFLANEFSRPPSVAAAILQCNARELRLLQLLLSVEGEKAVPWRTLVEMAGGKSLSSAMGGIVERLEELGLAFRIDNGVFVPGAVRMQVPASLSDRFTLSKCLATYDAPAVKRLCDKLGLRPEPDTKTACIIAIIDFLLKDGQAARLVERLDAGEQAVLAYLLQVGGTASATDVADAVLEGRTEDFFRYDWQNRWKQGRERNAVDRLLGRGLIFVVSHGYAYNLFLMVPGDLLRALTGGEGNDFWTAPPAAPVPLPKPPAVVARHTTVIRDAVTLIAAFTAQEAARTNTGHVHRTALKNAARLLSLPDERYAAFLYAVCRDADLIAPQGERQTYMLTAHGRAWLSWETTAQTQALFTAWQNGLSWGEMFNEPLRKMNEYRPTEIALRMRQTLLELVKESVGEPFLDIGSLTDTLTFRYPLMLASSAMMGMDLVPSPATFVRRLVCECAFRLGMAELGWAETPRPDAASAPTSNRAAGKSRASGLERGALAEPPTVPDADAYRLTPLGAFLLGVPNVPPPEEEPREEKFIVQANAEIFVPPYLEPATLYRLLTMTDVPGKGAAGNTVGLTRDSIRRALDHGETQRDLLAFLQSHARTGIPQNVEYLINEVGGKHGHIHIGKAQMYVQVDSPLLLQELQARRELKPYFVRALSDTVALLNAEDPEKLLRELRKAGYLPISDDAPKTPVFRAQTRHAPPSAEAAASLISASRSIKRAAKIESALDWDRIAREDLP